VNSLAIIRKANTEPSPALVSGEGVETMHSALLDTILCVGGEDMGRSTCIEEDVDLDRNDRGDLVRVCAGFVMGEGCIQITANKGTVGRENYTVRLDVTNVDPAPIYMFQRTFGGNVRRYPGRKKNCRAYHVWTVAAKKAAVVLEEILPFLVGSKKDQAIIALEFQSRKNKSHAGRSGLNPVFRELDQRDWTKMKELKWQTFEPSS